MTTVDIRIQDKEDSHKPLTPELSKATKIIHGNLQIFGILESGTNKGGTTVSFCAMLEDGSAVILETTANLFRGMAAALNGAEMKFEAKKAKKN